MAFVEMKQVYKRYRTGEVVTAASNGIDFTIEKGEFALIVGPSGAGKTTVLNILGGMDTADEGQVLVDGSDIVQYTPRQLIGYRRHDIGFVFQFYNLVQNLTALENVELAAQICKEPMDAMEVLTEVGLKDRAKNFPAQLSGGEQQRVAIARALAKNPKLLLCDEPTGALNQSAAKEVMREFVRLNREGATILLVTHDSKVAAACSRILYLLDGMIQGELSLTDLTETKAREEAVGNWLAGMGW